jgi:hypothetical protein
VPPAVAPVLERDVAAGAAQDDGVANTWRRLEGRVRVALQRHGAAVAQTFVLGDQHLAAHVVKAVGERVGGEAAEDDGVRGAEPGAG